MDKDSGSFLDRHVCTSESLFFVAQSHLLSCLEPGFPKRPLILVPFVSEVMSLEAGLQSPVEVNGTGNATEV